MRKQAEVSEESLLKRVQLEIIVKDGYEDNEDSDLDAHTF